MMSRRDNTLAFYNNQPHDHIVSYASDICSLGGGKLSFECGHPGGGPDGFGVVWEGTPSALGASTPVAGKYILEDVCAWKEVVTFPDLSKYNWEEEARKQLQNYDEKNQIKEFEIFNGQFLRFMSLLGFEEGLVSLIAEPEASYDLLNAITDYQIKLAEYAVTYFKPDSICLFDDFATERGLFLSPTTYRKMIKPMHKRLFHAIRDMGVIPSMHVCGKCEEVVEDFLDEGNSVWEICQPENNLKELQKKVGANISFFGGYDMKGPFSYTNPTEAELRESVRKTIDTYAPGGNYGFIGMILYSDPERFMKTMTILNDECIKYGTNYYKR